ncbi:IS3 family transposase [Myxococcus xanthus]|nr:IS3 family transposase [Myxococcus xanthus]
MTLAHVDEALEKGVRLEAICERLGVAPRTIQRWRKPATSEDRRCGPHTRPANRLSEVERRRILAVANSEEFRDVSPKQIVPRLADRGEYVASEASFYRVLREAGQLVHRGRAKAPVPRPRAEHTATGPCQVWSWDITYLKGPVKGTFLYLYLVVDVFSRRIMGFAVHEEESSEHAAALIRRSWQEAGCPEGLVLHSDNGGPMKGATLLATLQWLGVTPSFSRPRVSDDNAFSEALFRTLKYRPSFPQRPFASVEDACRWVACFVAWYNTEHRHSGIRYVTPEDRHFGREGALLVRRHQVYQCANARHSERWSRDTRDWTPAGPVRLGPSPNLTPAVLELKRIS